MSDDQRNTGSVTGSGLLADVTFMREFATLIADVRHIRDRVDGIEASVQGAAPRADVEALGRQVRALAKRLTALEAWRWRIVGASAAAAATGGALATSVLSSLGS